MKACRRCRIAAICVAALPTFCVRVVLRSFSGGDAAACLYRLSEVYRYIDVTRKCPRAE
jgi:hypothetical protein